MANSYQVMKGDYARTLPPKDNWPEKHVYSLLLDPLDGGSPIEAEEFRHPKAAPPQQGEHVEGEITKKGNFPFTFKRARKEEPGATGAPKPSDGTWKPSARDPLETKRIVHQHAQKVAEGLLRDATAFLQVRAYTKEIQTVDMPDVFNVAERFLEEDDKLATRIREAVERVQ